MRRILPGGGFALPGLQVRAWGQGGSIRPQCAVFCRVAASPYPAYGFVHEGRGESIRPQCAVFCRVAASPYPAYGFVHGGRGGEHQAAMLCILPGGGFALPGIRVRA
ncbi:hypothetical protein A6J71_16175 [Enterobacter cancerogenus]|nr:hypothetical protein A6J71_16175 [Enterobacter cancerogenus]